MTPEQCLAKVEESHKGMGYTFRINKWIGLKTSKVVGTCPIHGDFELTCRLMMNGAECPRCSEEKRINTCKKVSTLPLENMKRALCKKHKDTLSLNEETYISRNKKAIFHCNKCDRDFESSVDNILTGHGCPHCNTSTGENRIREYLESHNIKFESEKKFEGLIGLGKGSLRFDFYLPEYNTCIEFQGKQHYETVDFAGCNNEEQLQEDLFRNKVHDLLKKDYCKEHNIKLIEIDYNLDNIEKELEKQLTDNTTVSCSLFNDSKYSLLTLY